MSARSKTTGRQPEQLTITVCRGCCCGNSAEHPSVDAAAQLARLRAGVAGHARIRVTDCLDVCEMSNVLIVSPSPAAREAGARAVWLGRVLADSTIDDVVAWAVAGGPGRAEPPVGVEVSSFAPARRVREAGEAG